MAKTIGALFSMEASGKFGDSVIYDRRGYARVYSKPSNPKTANQGNVRLRVQAVQAVIKELNAATRSDLEAYAASVGVPSYRWASVVAGEIVKGWATYKAAYWDTFSATYGTDWDNSAGLAGVVVAGVDYASDTITAGMALAQFAHWMYLRGLIVAAIGTDTPDDAADTFLN